MQAEPSLAHDTAQDLNRPVLHLSGPRLTRSFETLVERSEDHGGIESYIAGLRFKSSVIQEALSPERLLSLSEADILGISAFMASVRRRIGPWVAEAGIQPARQLITVLLDGATDAANADERFADFCASFPEDKAHRWVQDFAAEILHAVHPEQYPLMTRWVWDRTANSGVLREIWHS